MEKIAFKNTQVGGANTYELAYDSPRQLIASYSEFDEIRENESAILNITSQDRILSPIMPFDIRLLQIVLYFSEGNNQNMRLIISGASVSTTFQVPAGGGTIILGFDNEIWAEGVPLRMDVQNLETISLQPHPILRGWCLTYNIDAP